MKTRTAELLGFLFLVSGGCGVADVDVPPPLAEIEANRAVFFQPKDHPLSAVEPGTIIDELSGLDGCWGSAEEQRSGDRFLRVVEFLRFDWESGELVREILSRSPRSLIVVHDVFTLEPGPEADAITLDLVDATTEGAVLSVDLGDLVDFVRLLDAALADGTPVEPEPGFSADEGKPFVLQITLDGDAFVITSSTATPGEDSSYPILEGTIYQRVDCPDSVAAR